MFKNNQDEQLRQIYRAMAKNVRHRIVIGLSVALVIVGGIVIIASSMGAVNNIAGIIGGIMIIGFAGGFGIGIGYGMRFATVFMLSPQATSFMLPSQPKIYCSSCGTENSVEATFCFKCGKKIAGA
jgi:uncharacterized membrane protein